ncbi:MAG: GFA family protein [Deltaproteobacteria bacterium]|nr:GFA family protein [Deltaproteobacteria bacterium]
MARLPFEGGCQCGALRYRVTQAPIMVYNCHCTNCQRIGGGAFSTPATILEASFAFVSGTPQTIQWAADSGTTRFGWFCRVCGCRIVHGQQPSNGILSLRTGTLDDRSWVQPVGDIWTRSAQPWVTIPPERQRFERQPTDYAPLVAAFRQLGHFPTVT